jgi:hypothetical protein
MFQRLLSVDNAKRNRRLLSLLSGFLVVAVLVGAILISIAARGGVHAASASYTRTQIITIIKDAFGTGALGNQAVSVATCESSLNPNALNPSSDAKGLFQIIPGTWAMYGKGNPDNPTDNAQAARRIYNAAHGWSPWVCQPSTASGCPATIQNGSGGSVVVTLQSKLDSLYSKKVFPNSPYNFKPLLAKDGQFGSLTTNAVKDFQKKKGLSVDGVVGAKTWHALGSC